MDVKLYFLSLMRDERSDALSRIIKLILACAGFVYGFCVRVRTFIYFSGLKKMIKAGKPVISVGNLTLGGTGKTPFIEYLASRFIDKGVKPVILTRGYGNDECRMLEDKFGTDFVLRGSDRAANASMAVDSGADLLLMDDGFQHLRLDRDLNILLVDANNPFGNGKLFPRGELREPVSTAERADIIVFSKVDNIEDANLKTLEEICGGYGAPIIMCRHKPVSFFDPDGKSYPCDSMKGKKVCIFSGIGDPGYFEATIKELGICVDNIRIFPDHYSYTETDISGFSAGSDDLLFVTTEKDWMKIRDMDLGAIRGRIRVLKISLEIIKGEGQLIDRLDSFVSC